MAKLFEWNASLPDRDASVVEFLKGKREEISLPDRIKALRAQLVQSKTYASHQGSTVTPRPFWVVRVQTATRGVARRGEEVVPLVEGNAARVRSSERATRVQGQGKRKQAWRGTVLEGSVPVEFLFGLLTSKYVGNFSVLHRDLCVVPGAIKNGGLEVFHHLASRSRSQRTLSHEDPNESLLRSWVQSAQRRWQTGRQPDQQGLCTERLDYNGGLTSQPASSPRVVHTRSGNFYAALLRPDASTSTGLKLDRLDVKFIRNGKASPTPEKALGGVIVDNLLHWIEVKSAAEGYWLVGILNSAPFVEMLDHDVQGRDYYSAPSRILERLELRYESSNPTHQSIADRARLIESKKTAYDRGLLLEELGTDLVARIDDSDASPEVPRIKWSFKDLCENDKEVGIAFASINAAAKKLLS
jgi:hypothetical protein